MAEENPTASRTTPIDIENVMVFATTVAICRISQESASPNRQPMRLTTSASIRNCIMMLFLPAPMALRIPISLVRSVTETSMMFMMPIPPTSSEIAAMPPSSSESVPVTVLIASEMLLMFMSRNASSS